VTVSGKPSVDVPQGTLNNALKQARLNPNLSQMMLDLACFLIPQEIFPQSAVVTDTPLLRDFPCETNILRDIGANL
jgi:hypothetical protein